MKKIFLRSGRRVRHVLEHNKWIIAGGFVLLYCVWINRFPAGHIIAGADVIQFIDAQYNLRELFYHWFGRATLFYVPFYILDVLGVSQTAQLSVYLGGFLFAAYVSFLIFMRVLLPRAPQHIAMLVSLFYATNIYTLYIFTSTWGYTHYQILYVFIPMLTAFYVATFSEVKNVSQRYRYLVAFLLTVVVASISFGNPAFAVSSFIYFVILTILLFVFHVATFNHVTVRMIGIVAVVSFFLNAYWILPMSVQVRSGVAEVATSQDIVLEDVLTKTSNAIGDTLRLMQTYERKAFYPDNFPYPSVRWLQSPVLFVAFTPFLIALFGLFIIKSRRGIILYMMFFVLFVLFVVLVSRARFPFEYFNSILFQLPGLNVLRGWDKTAIFTPFILTALIALTLTALHGKFLHKTVSLLFCLLMMTLAAPFYFGGIQTSMSYALKNEGEKDFRSARYSALVEIPQDYYDAQKVFDDNDGDYRIAMLPFAPGSSVGKVDLPMWRLNAPHVAHYLYDKEYVEINGHYLSGWDFGPIFAQQYYDATWIIDLYGFIGVRYVMYHKDIDPDTYDKMESSRKRLVSMGAVVPVLDTYSYTLYEIDAQKILPRVYASDTNDLSMNFDAAGMSLRTAGLRSDMVSIKYDTHNSREFIVAAKKLQGSEKIVLNEKYEMLWRAYYHTCDGTRILLTRDTSVTYANAWNVPEGNICGSVTIVHRSLELMRVGILMTGVALIGVMIAFVLLLQQTRNRKK